MRIGIVPGLNASDGGIYQYSFTMLQALDNRQTSRDSFILFADKMRNPAVVALRNEGWVVKPLVPITSRRRFISLAERVVGPRPREATLKLASRLLHRNQGPSADPNKVQFNYELEQWFLSNGIELMLYPISSSLSFETRIPYVMSVHDLQHRLQPEFPEVSANGEGESREYLFRNGIRNATLLLAESETGKEDILNFYGQYGATPDRIKILPLLPSCTLAPQTTETEQRRIRGKYCLPDHYLFYPAQFWPHKNHVRVVEALGLLRQRYGLKIPIAFCGSHSGAIREQVFREVKAVTARCDLTEQIHYLGYVPDADISGLYVGATALIMPTFFGPSNIPVLEAWQLNCPVLTSDIRGIREQSGDAAILIDPGSVEQIADGINCLWTDAGLRRTLVERGQRRLRTFTPDDFKSRLMQILEEAKTRVRSERERRALR